MFRVIPNTMTTISLQNSSSYFFYYGGISEIISYLPWRNLRNNFLYPEDSHDYENENKQKRHFAENGDYSSTANCLTKIPVLFRRMDFTLRVIFRFLLIHLTILTDPLRVFCLTLVGKNRYRAVNRRVECLAHFVL